MTKAPQGRGRAGVNSGNLRAEVFCPLPEPDSGLRHPLAVSAPRPPESTVKQQWGRGHRQQGLSAAHSETVLIYVPHKI